MPHSIEDLMGIALGMEHEAALRYRQLSQRMECLGDAALAATFEKLAVLEQSHEHGLADWARREGRPVPEAKQFRWRLPETFAEADIAGAPLSAYQALAIAVRNEEQAFSFYSYLSAMTDVAPDLRHYAEALAREELTHLAQLRGLRRQAFHAERLAGKTARPEVSDLPAFYRFAWGLESGSAALCRLLLERLVGRDERMAIALLDRTGSAAERRATLMAKQAGGGAVPSGSRVVEAARSKNLFAMPDVPAGQVIALCERDTQEVLDAYLTIAEAATDGALLTAAQESAEHALARLAIVRSQRSQLFPSD
jgi:rubrerythrin